MSKIEYDLKKLSDEFQIIFNNYSKYSLEKDITRLQLKLYNFKTTYLAPAYHLNRFDEVTENFFKIDMPNILNKGVVDDNDRSLASCKLHLEFYSVLYSLKMSLDRIVFFVSVFYKGVSPQSTFGRIGINGKAKSMMAEVVRLKRF